MSKKLSPAAKLALIQELLVQPIYDEYGNFIGYEKVDLITREQAIELLNSTEEDE